MTDHTNNGGAPSSREISRRTTLRRVAACGSCVVGILLSQPALAQQVTAQATFTQTYGGNGQDRTRSVVQTQDGGFALAGFSESFGAGDRNFLLVKTDEQGNEQFIRTYGGSSSDSAQKFVQTQDGGYALAGHSRSFGAGGKDFWLVKTDAQGNIQFSQTYGGSGNDEARAVAQTRDGGYALVGWTTSFGPGSYPNGWLVKTDAQGNEQFTRTYGGDDRDVARSIEQTRDGGYAFVGRTRSSGAGHDDFWLVKTDRQGNVQFTQTYGGSGRDVAASVVQTQDGGYAIAGPSRSFGSEFFNFWLVKTDAQGKTQFTRAYGGAHRDSAQSIVQTREGGYALAGATRSYGDGGNDFWLVKTDRQGNAQLTQTYGGSENEGAGSLVQARDGGYALTGSTKSFGTADSADAWLVITKERRR